MYVRGCSNQPLSLHIGGVIVKEVWIEIFKDYLVSNKGQVKSLKYNEERILKHSIDRKGYHRVHLSINGKQKFYQVHRLVALAFIPNPDNKPQVNHKDGNKDNCCVSNLEWNTNGENGKHAYKMGLRKHLTRKVNQYDLEGNLLKTWDSIKEAQEEYKINHISQCCRGKRYKTVRGYIWKYADTE